MSFWRGPQAGTTTVAFRIRRFYVYYYWTTAHLQISLGWPVWFIHVWRFRVVIGTDGPHWRKAHA